MKLELFTHCPFCQDEMQIKTKRNVLEYFCRGKEDHTFIHQHDTEEDTGRRRIVRVGEGEERCYLDVAVPTNDPNDQMFVLWSGRFNSPDRIYLNDPIKLDFSKGIEYCKRQIQVYLTFS